MLSFMKMAMFGIKSKWLLPAVIDFWILCFIFVGVGLMINAAAEKINKQLKKYRERKRARLL
ncbi:hypothetical protein TrispH2_004681 [Trichoplax sp. H2]|nr:hypothetical protein TrispH2_004681 [Trichoplax sp. H2]|eukprot:RDD44196.1 hypothetical protein TrispH2_004681 [Trichoplax sp. H2]